MNALRILMLVAAAAFSTGAMAHAVVKQSVPAEGARLTAAPKEVTITFNEKVEKMFTSAVLKTAAGVAIDTAKATRDAANPAVLHLPLPALPAGAYVVTWTAVGQDGHRQSGHIGFSVTR
ncbi:MAG: copper resistance CopC family protein [Pseudomonadota bacterium]